jgi:microcystin-dependent protein
MDNAQVFIKAGSSAATPMNTPNLLGRTIVGATPEEWMNNASANITKRNIGDSGGEETHILAVNEMPAHGHNLMSSQLFGNFGAGGITWWGVGPGGNNYGPYGNTTSAGSGAPHNNMQPFVAITYIIKKPLQGVILQI